MKHIRKNRILTFASVLTVTFIIILLNGCSKTDPGLEYNAINDVTIKDSVKTSVISIALGDSLKISNPVIQSQISGQDNLLAEWSTYEFNGAGNQTPISVLSTSINLKIVVGAPFALGKQYRLTEKITDKTTGVSRFFVYNLTIVNDFAQGYFVLEEKPTGTDFSFLKVYDYPFKYRVTHNLYSTLNGGVMPGKPKQLLATTFIVTDNISVPSRRLYMISDAAGAEIDYSTFMKKFDYNFLFYKAPGTAKPSVLNLYPAAQCGLIINDGKAHVNAQGGFPGAKKWADQLLSPAGLDYDLAPFVAPGSINSGLDLYYQMIVYDKKGKKFLAIQSPGTKLSAFPTNASNTVFDMNNVGMDMIFMGPTNVATSSNAVMRDAALDTYFFQFKNGYRATIPAITQIKRKLTVPDADKISLCTNSIISPHLFYAAGNKIYRYEPSSNTALAQFSFPADEQITMMKMPPANLQFPALAVATWNGVEGKLYFFDISFVGATVYQITVPRDVFTGFGKIYDLQLKT